MRFGSIALQLCVVMAKTTTQTTNESVDVKHPDFDNANAKWEIVRDVLDGEDAVKAANEKYLPYFEDTETDEWKKYRDRADFFEITARVLIAMIGFLFRRDPRLEAPGIEPDDKDAGSAVQQFNEFLKDATLTGKEFYDVAKDASRTAVPYGRGGFLIDWSEAEGHPFCVLYAPWDIINWRYEKINGRLMLTLLMLHEQAVVNKDDYATDIEDRWRELRLVGNPDIGYVVSCRVWRRKEGRGGAKKPEFEIVPDAGNDPMRKKVPLDEIPFVFCTPEGNHGEYIAQPPLLPMARLNLSHYRTSADLENARHVLGMPTPWAAGFGDEDTTLYLGSSKAWCASDPSARCGFLALTGTDLQALTDAKKEKQEEMAQLGARMLDPSVGNTPEAYATVALRQTGDTAALVDISLGLTQSLTDVLAWALWWSSSIEPLAAARDVVSYTLNTNFVGSTMDAPTITALFSLYLQRGISFETLFARLQGADIIPADRTVDEEKQLIAKGESLLSGMMGVSAQGNGTKNANAGRTGSGKGTSDTGNKGAQGKGEA